MNSKGADGVKRMGSYAMAKFHNNPSNVGLVGDLYISFA